MRDENLCSSIEQIERKCSQLFMDTKQCISIEFVGRKGLKSSYREIITGRSRILECGGCNYAHGRYLSRLEKKVYSRYRALARVGRRANRFL